jgi:hypothetical protein
LDMSKKDKKVVNGFGVTDGKEIGFLRSLLRLNKRPPIKDYPSELEKASRDFTLKARKTISRQNPSDNLAFELALLRKVEGVGDLATPVRLLWRQPEPILLALVRLVECGKISSIDVIKFETTGEITTRVMDELYMYLANSYIQEGASILAPADNVSYKKMLRVGKRSILNPWYYRVWKFLKKKRSIKFWKKKKKKKKS